MVLQVLADARHMVRDRDPERLQPLAAADAGQLEDLRRADGAGGEDRLAPSAG
jgi:hypothetical protein